MNKLARKLSVFALSSVILLANSPIKAGMFAEGQTYDLGAVGKVNIRNHGINNDGSLEAFDVHIKDLELDIDVYRENDGIAYVLRKTGNVVSSDTIEHCEDFRNAEYVLKILIEKITEKKLPTFPRLIPSTPESSMTTIETSISDNNNKHVAEKKPKKAHQPKYRKITYTLPTGTQYNYALGHCDCDHPARPINTTTINVQIEGKQVQLISVACKTCCRPVRQTHKNNKGYRWTTYCNECNQETEFYMKRGTGEKCILICCNAYPFAIHEIEYASTTEFNDAVDRGRIKYICSKNPDHTRAHVYNSRRRVTACCDCWKLYSAKYYKKKIKNNSTS